MAIPCTVYPVILQEQWKVSLTQKFSCNVADRKSIQEKWEKKLKIRKAGQKRKEKKGGRDEDTKEIIPS
jgi:hypothetical protein